MSLARLAERLVQGEKVTFRPRGQSMAPLVCSGQEVVVAPCNPSKLEPGDVVLVNVHGVFYLHKILRVDEYMQRVQIGNNRGGVNGWTGFHKVYGICTSVGGRQRPRLSRKVLG